MDGRITRMRLVGAVLALGLVAAACSQAGASTGSGGGMSVSIVSPSDGATVSEPFTVKLDTSVPIGDPSTGEHHVHLCFDGASCDDLSGTVITYADSVQVSTLSPGTHTIEASLRNADHSDAGVSTQITITVSGGQSGQATGSTGGSSGGHGYGSGYGN
jgi:hypothetical protein